MDTTKAELVTRKHQQRVQELLLSEVKELIDRAVHHDASKLDREELEPWQGMEELIEREGQVPYGSPAYEERMKIIEPMATRHYRLNTHHPQHYPGGVRDMDLLDVVEMLIDWKAASERGGADTMSLEAALNRFKIDGLLGDVIRNTVENRGWKA
jgi:hypothetical protein